MSLQGIPIPIVDPPESQYDFCNLPTMRCVGMLIGLLEGDWPLL